MKHCFYWKKNLILQFKCIFLFFAWNPSWQKDFSQGFHPILSQSLQIFQDGIRTLLPQYCVLEEKLSAPEKIGEPATCVLCSCEGYCKYNEIDVLIPAFIEINLKKKFLKHALPPDNKEWERERDGKREKAGSMQGLFAYSYETVLHFLLITLTCFSWLSSSICVTSA